MHSATAKPLTGWAVFTLRPAGEARALLSLLRAQGADALNLPLLRLRAHAPPSLAAALADVLDVSTWIFSSPAAVRSLVKTAAALGLAGKLFDETGLLAECARRGRVFAPGPGTARALEKSGISPVQVPDLRFDSEGLLDLPALAGPLHGRIVVVGGDGGRGAIERVLAQRGANMDSLRLYRRVPVALTSEQAERLNQPRRTMIIASSGSMLAQLSESLSSQALRRLSGRTPIVLSSDRLCHQARTLGFRHCLQARSAMPDALVEAAISAAKSFADVFGTRDSVSMTS